MRRFGWLLVLVGVVSCGRSRANAITIKGSDTLLQLTDTWAGLYMQANPGLSVQVTGGGSGTGIAALINGGTDICMASRRMKDKERRLAEKRHGKPVREFPVALDAIAIYVHPSNAIESLTVAQIESIYSGRVRNWKELGGADQPIVAYSRENSSGTYEYFKERVLRKKDFAPFVATLPGTAGVVNSVSEDRSSIGYGGIAFGSRVRIVPVRNDPSSPAVEPTLANVHAKRYPLWRELYFYTAGEPEGRIKNFIDWALSDEGQKVCEQVGYLPLPAK